MAGLGGMAGGTPGGPPQQGGGGFGPESLLGLLVLLMQHAQSGQGGPVAMPGSNPAAQAGQGGVSSVLPMLLQALLGNSMQGPGQAAPGMPPGMPRGLPGSPPMVGMQQQPQQQGSPLQHLIMGGRLAQ